MTADGRGEVTEDSLTGAGRVVGVTPVGVEKRNKSAISVNFSAYGKRTFNNLRTNFAVEIP
jgi:hypothetical protein